MNIQGKIPPESGNIQHLARKGQKGVNEQIQAKSISQGGGGADKVTISDKAKELEGMKQDIARLPDIRTEKVEAVRQQIEAGTYEVDPVKIAGRMIDEII